MERFKASTQYGDWKGSASADRADGRALANLLDERGLRRENEFLAGSKLWVGENHDGKLGMVSATAWLIDLAGHDDVPAAIAAAGDGLRLRKVDLDLTLEEFVCLFKRFAVSLSDPHLDLEGRDFTAV